MNRWRWWPVVFLALVTLIPVLKPLAQGETIGAFDQIQQMAPWNGSKPSEPWDVLQADSVLQFFGWRDLVFHAWGKHELPLWNPYQLCGTPLLANSQSAGFYPPHILIGVFRVPTGLAIVLLAWFHLFWASLGAYTLSRRIGASRVGGVIAGTSFGLSSFMLAWIALPSVVSTVAWIPWVVSGVLALWEDRTIKAMALTAFSTAMMVFAGHLQFVAYGLMMAVLVLIVNVIATRSWKQLATGAIALAVGITMALPQLLPVLDYSKYSHRQNKPSAEGYSAYIGSAIPPSQLIARLANPFSQGNPTRFAVEGSDVTSYWPAIAKPGDNFAESASTVGPIVLSLLLIPLGLKILQRRWKLSSSTLAIAIASLFALLIAIGTPLNRLLYFGVPGWSASGSPGRMVVLFVLGACVLAGIGASRTLELPSKQWGTIAAAGFVLVGLTFSLAMKTGEPPQGLDNNTWQAITQYALRSNATSLIIYALIPIAAVVLIQRKLYWVVALLPVVLTSAWIVSGLVRTGNPQTLHRKVHDTDNRVAFVNDDWQLVGAGKAIMPPNTATINRIHDVAGYDSLLAASIVESLKQANGQDPAPPANGNMMFIKPKANFQKIADMGVDEVQSLKPIESLGSPVDSEDGLLTYKLSSKGRAFMETEPASITYDGTDHQTVEAQGPGKLVVKDRNFPGWTAKVDGLPAILEGTEWREVQLKEGRHVVEFRYEPPGMKSGFIIGLIGWVICLMMVFLGSKRWEKREQTTKVS